MMRASTKPAAINRTSVPLSALLICAFTLAGCDAIEDLGTDGSNDKKPNSNTNSTGGSTAGQTTDATIPDPIIELKLGDIPIAAKQCHVTVLPAAGGYPATVQVSSYPSPSAESFPSILIQADISSDNLTEVLNQKFPAKIHVKEGPKAVDWITPDGQPGEITIQNADDSGRVVGTFSASAMRLLGSSDELTLSGSFDGRAVAK
jgi:predicted small secreted protein